MNIFKSEEIVEIAVLNKNILSKIAQKKREEIIRNFYDSKKANIIKSAEAGHTGHSVTFDTLDDEVKMALKVEEKRLSEIIKDVNVKLTWSSNLLFSNYRYISEVVFDWK